MIPIGTVLREARLRAGMEQRALAAAMSVSSFTLNRVERGRQRFRDEWLDRMPAAIGGPVADALAVYYRELAEEVGRKVAHKMRRGAR